MVLHMSLCPWARWRGHSHDLVTGPDSRVASHVGGMVEIPGETARRPLPLHPFSRPPHLSHTAGRVLGAVRSGAPDPFLRQSSQHSGWAVSIWSSRLGMAAAHTPGMQGWESSLSPLYWSAAPLPAGHTSPTGLTAARRGRLASCSRSRAQRLQWLAETTHSCTIWQPDRRRPPTCSNAGPPKGTVASTCLCQQGRRARTDPQAEQLH